MLKHLTIVALAGALLPACILTTGDTATDTNVTTEASEGTTAGTGTTGGTTAAPGTTDDSDSATTAVSETDSGTTASTPTTGEPTTGEPTTGEPGTTTTGGTTTGGPTSDYGMCGWVAAENFYGCAEQDGADPGVEDPAAIDPIACDPAVIEGAPCNEKEGPVKNIGCCAPNGDLFLCDSQGEAPTDTIVKFACGA